MKKLLFIPLILCFLLLTGCNDSPEVEFCNKIDPYIEKYNKKQISYSEFLNQIKNDYNNYCTDQEYQVCLQLKYLYSSNNVDTTLEDCSKYKNESFKKLCESSNEVKKDIVANKSKVEEAKISEVSFECAKAKEK